MKSQKKILQRQKNMKSHSEVSQENYAAKSMKSHKEILLKSKSMQSHNKSMKYHERIM
jgi:hypothetical protein